MDRIVSIQELVRDSIFSYAQMFHPRETVLLLRGEVDRHRILVNDTQIPPLAIHGNTFPLTHASHRFFHCRSCSFSPIRLSGPSITDLNIFYGRIMVITVYPYQSEKNIAILDKGKPLKHEAP